MPPLTTKAQPAFLAALAGQNHAAPPVWLMRQAGRTLASYRQLRAGHEFLDFCKNVDLAAEATLLPIRELGVDAAILFADILLPVEALGLKLRFEESVGPITEPLLNNGAAIAKLKRDSVEKHCGYVAAIIQKLRRDLPPHAPLIGFCPSPWTLAAYVVEGRGKKGFPGLKKFLYGDRPGFETLLDVLTDLLIDYSTMQIRAGAQAFQIFDTWAELLTPQDFRELVRPRLQKLAAATAAVPTIYFPKGTAQVLPDLGNLSVRGVGCDWTVDLPAVRRAVGPKLALQGNLDPSALYAPPAQIESAVHRMLDSMRGDPAYIVNLGHGLSPDIPEAHVHAFVRAVRAWSADQ